MWPPTNGEAAYLLAADELTSFFTNYHSQRYVGGELVYGFGLEVRHRYKRLPLHDS